MNAPFTKSRTTSVSLEPGLILLRYASADDGRNPPSIALDLRGTADRIAFLPEPGEASSELHRPGQCLVMSVAEPTKVELEIRAGRPGGSLEAKVRVEYLTDEGPRRSSRPVSVVRPRADVDTSSLAIVGHVARVGDVTVRPNRWLGGPDNPGRIEGFTVRWPDMTDGVLLRYGVAIGQSQANDDIALRNVGTFVGSKGRSRPITALSFELSGSDSDGAEIVVEAMFLGCASVVKRGRSLVLRGDQGTEPLVGLRLQIKGVEDDAASSELNRKTASNDETPRVRVFRSDSFA
ncbi:MAG: hypothetical protein AAF311_15900 [Pseudomonadota bacterium]